MNTFQVFDQGNSLKNEIVGDFISICLEYTPAEIFIRKEQDNLIIVVHINGEVLKEEIIPIKSVYG